ncbi:retrovirus-related pol polyprotein from transposon TNT 1-94 [Tanacetum coccineum]
MTIRGLLGSEVVINFLKQIQICLNNTVRYIHTNNGTKFVNQVLTEFYEKVGIFHQKSIPRNPQQNGVVERRNRTLVEVSRTMLLFSKALMFLWAEAVATAYNMANENVPAPAPTRSDDQILPFAAWVPIGKSNFALDLQKKQNNPIFLISMDIVQNTNFFRAFTTSSSVPTIYIQQFWNTLTYEAKTEAYSF